MKGIISRADLGYLISTRKQLFIEISAELVFGKTLLNSQKNTYDGVIFCKKILRRTLPSLQLISEVCGTGLHHFVETMKS